ncbi:hypothetical protein Cme02nite_19530 [Catellatospora methionotrophica]|uniref:DUF4132 domain-containing protein n=1 Tax=Catellatospora methionotrophica TaxID=121620 RepID=A0A8J3PDL1_9ACTN|nr:DUF4132 domain-containing protein [Catellatospora methionotrophica]GIG13621.1 hypothetical protein Cme02nite_19530 [Catellatospora methionotrophica]
MNGETEPGWLPAGTGYQVALSGGRVVARKASGVRLKGLPAALKDDPVVRDLRQLREWLARHEAECLAEVERWMVRGLPVAFAVLARVWADEAWRAALRDLVVAPCREDGPDLARAGFLRDVDAARGVGVVGLDGESAWLGPGPYAVPHPVLLDDVDELREFAAELDVRQGVAQLFREAHRRPEGRAEQAALLHGYDAAHYAQLRHASSRALALGYTVRGGTARCRIVEHGRAVDACVWLGDGDPGYETWTGPLQFADPSGRGVPGDEVGPVTWSEGVRLAAALHVGRTGTSTTERGA